MTVCESFIKDIQCVSVSDRLMKGLVTLAHYMIIEISLIDITTDWSCIIA